MMFGVAMIGALFWACALVGIGTFFSKQSSVFLQFVLGFAFSTLVFSIFGIINHLSLWSGLFVQVWGGILFLCSSRERKLPKLSWQLTLVLLAAIFFIALRAFAPTGGASWGDVLRYYGFFSKYFVAQKGIGNLIQLLPAYGLFPLSPAFATAGLWQLWGESTAKFFNATLILVLACAVYGALIQLKVSQFIGFLAAVSVFLVGGPLQYEMDPLHFRVHEFFWMGTACILMCEMFISPTLFFRILLGMCLGLAASSLYSSALIGTMVMAGLVLASGLGMMPISSVLQIGLSALLIAAPWYWRVFFLSGSPVGFHYMKPEWISPHYYSSAFGFFRLLPEMRNVILPTPFYLIFPAFGFLFLKLGAFFYGNALVLLKRIRSKLPAEFMLMLFVAIVFCLFSYFFILKNPAEVYGQKRYFYVITLFLIFPAAVAWDIIFNQIRAVPIRLILSVMLVVSTLTGFAGEMPRLQDTLSRQVNWIFKDRNLDNFLIKDTVHDLVVIKNWVKTFVPAEDGILTNFSDFSFYVPNPVHGLGISMLGGNEAGTPGLEFLEKLRLAGVRWFVFDSLYLSMPFNDRGGTLYQSYNPALQKEFLSHLEPVSTEFPGGYFFGLYRIRYDLNPRQSVAPEFEPWLEAQKLLQNSTLKTWQDYRTAFYLHPPTPFSTLFEVKIKSISTQNGSFQLEKPAHDLFVNLRWNQDPIEVRGKIMLMNRKGQILDQKEISKLFGRGQLIHFHWDQREDQVFLKTDGIPPSVIQPEEVLFFNVLIHDIPE